MPIMKNRFMQSLAAVTVSVGLMMSAGASSASAATNADDIRVKTSSKSSVTKAYKKYVANQVNVKTRWTGSLSKCKVGKENAASIKATRQTLNFSRALVQLDPVYSKKKWNRDALYSALLTDASDVLTHYPNPNLKCYTKTGARGSGTSNIAWSSGYKKNMSPVTGARGVINYLTDDGDNNLAVGHRRWLLYPELRGVGIGNTPEASAIKVIGTQWSDKAASPTWVEWPAKGYFPAQMEPGGRWSLTHNSRSAKFNKAKISVTEVVTGKKLKVKKYKQDDGAGNNTVVFAVKGVKNVEGTTKARSYRVKVKGIKGVSKKHSSYTYTVKLFDPMKTKK